MNLKVALCVALVFAVPTSLAQVPRFGHVFLVVEENQGYSSVIGNPSVPYLNGLANRFGLATNYFSDTHPSMGNYFMLTTGEVISNDDSYEGTVTVDNIVRQLVKTGKTWKSYAESLPSIGYTGADIYPYAKHHNPIAYVSDITGNPTQQNNLVPFSQFASDLVGGTLPAYSFIVPNVQNDAHDCPAGMTTCTNTDKLSNADHWLQTNIDPLVKSPMFQTDGLLVIVFDEAGLSTTTNGGGHVAAVVVSPKVKWPGYKGTAFYRHENVLRLMAASLGLTQFPGSSSFVSDMAQFFGEPTWPCPVVNNGYLNANAISICTPPSGSILTSPVGVFAIAAMSKPIVTIQFMIDGSLLYQGSADRISMSVTLGAGTHRLDVHATDNSGVTVSSTIRVTVVSP